VNVQLLVDVEKNVITMPAAAVQTARMAPSSMWSRRAQVAVQPVTLGVADAAWSRSRAASGRRPVVIDAPTACATALRSRSPTTSRLPKRSRRRGARDAMGWRGVEKRDSDPEKARERRARKRPDAE